MVPFLRSGNLTRSIGAGRQAERRWHEAHSSLEVESPTLTLLPPPPHVLLTPPFFIALDPSFQSVFVRTHCLIPICQQVFFRPAAALPTDYNYLVIAVCYVHKQEIIDKSQNEKKNIFHQMGTHSQMNALIDRDLDCCGLPKFIVCVQVQLIRVANALLFSANHR